MFPIRDINPRVTFPFVTVALIIINLITFVLTFTNIGDVALVWGATPSLILHGTALYTLVTSMFLHANFLHLSVNMWFLWIFGDNVEDKCGHFRFLTFYILGGLIATVAFSLFKPNSTTPLIGASGAVSAVMGGYMVSFPQAKVETFLFLKKIKISAIYFLFIWIAFQIMFGIVSLYTVSGVAYLAHIGGFLFGALSISRFRDERKYLKAKADKGLARVRAVKSKCDGCGDCVSVCPVDAAWMQEEEVDTPYSLRSERKKLHRIDSFKCNFCRKCIDICPRHALSIKKKRAEEGLFSKLIGEI